MEWLLKIVDLVGGFDGIRKVLNSLDGKKTYTACSLIILGAMFWIGWTLYLFAQKQVDANTAYLQITVCAAALGDAVKSLFQRMATAKHDQMLKIAIEAQAVKPVEPVQIPVDSTSTTPPAVK